MWLVVSAQKGDKFEIHEYSNADIKTALKCTLNVTNTTHSFYISSL